MAETYYQRSGINGSGTGGILGADVNEADAGDDGSANPNTPAEPLESLGGAIFYATSDGDGISAAGRTRGPYSDGFLFVQTDGPPNQAIGQWDGEAPSHMIGSVAVGTSGYTPSGAGWVVNIGAGLGLGSGPHVNNLVTVTFDAFDPSNSDAVGRCKAHLKPAASESLARSETTTSSGARGGWHYDNATGDLSFSLPAGKDPTTPVADGLAYVVAAQSALGRKLTTLNDSSTDGFSVTGLRFSQFAARTAAPLGCCVAVQGGIGCTVEDNVFVDSGIHTISCGGACEDYTIRNNDHIGANQGTIFIAIDPQGTTGGTAHQATGCLIEGDRFYCHSLLCHDGTLANRSGAVGAIILHASSPASINDVTIRDVQIIEYSPPSGTPDAVTHFTLADTYPPGDDGSREIETNYLIKVVQTRSDIFTIDNGTYWPDQGVLCGAAFRRGRFRFQRAGQLTNGYMIDLRSLTGCIAFFGWEFIARFNNTGRDMSLFGLGANSMVICVNCSFLDYSAGPGGAFAFSIARMTAATASFRAYGCVFSSPTAGAGKHRVISGDSAAAFNNGGGLVTLEDCIFHGITADEFGENATYNTEAEFQSVYPNGNLIVPDCPFVDPTGLTDLQLTPTYRAMRYSNVVRALAGVNQKPWAGNYGAWQDDLVSGVGARRIANKIGIGL